MRIIFIVLIGGLLASCVDLEKSTQIESIDAMNSTLDSIEIVLEEHTFDSLFPMQRNSYAIENRVKNYYVSDTIDLALGRKMDAFKKMRKNMEPLARARQTLLSSIKEERLSLIDLQNDIDGSNGEREKYGEFIQFEEAKLDQLRALINDYVTTKISVIETYESYYDDLNEFSFALLPKNKE